MVVTCLFVWKQSSPGSVITISVNELDHKKRGEKEEEITVVRFNRSFNFEKLV